MIRSAGLFVLLCLAGCKPAPDAATFPKAARPVAPIVGSSWSDERSRDSLGEGTKIMDLAGVTPGMTVADIGAGEGYYTIRLAARVGEKGRVVAQDIVPEVRDALAERVGREGLDNVSVKLGEAGDPMLPSQSFDRVFLVHMYHEIGSPYEFLWNLRPSLAKGGQVIVIDGDRPTTDHGTPSALLQCEFAAVGYRLVTFQRTAFAGGYFAAFEAANTRPAPGKIKPCKLPS